MNRLKKAVVSALAALCILAVAASATAEPGFQYKVNSKVQASDGHPKLTLQATGTIKTGTAHFRRSDGKKFARKIGAMKAGETKEFALKQPAGTFSYKVNIIASDGSGEDVEMNLEFETTYVEELQLSVDPQKARIDKGEVPVTANRPIERVEIGIFDSNGNKMHEATQSMGGKKGTFMVEWPAKSDVGGIRLKVHDVDGFWQSVLLEPFWVEIPHEEVNFNTGKATWEDSEEPKLDKTLASVREAMEKHGSKGLQLQLFIAGYTDTVGSKSDNQKLSTARARAIARWFRKQGLDIPVYYQGFGESVLAVETADETEESRNRRAVYVLGNAQPPTSETMPKSNWKRVK